MSEASGPNFSLGLGFGNSPQPGPSQGSNQPPAPAPAPVVAQPIRICCVGAGRLGVLPMLVMADACENVHITVVDTDATKIEAWNRNHYVNDPQLLRFPVYEPGLLELYLQVRPTNRLFFSPCVVNSIRNTEVIFIAVDIPSVKQPAVKRGRKEMSEWDYICRIIKQAPRFEDKVVITISTVPPDFKTRLRQIFNDPLSNRFLYNPSFMREGTAIEDLQHPSLVLIAYEVNDIANPLDLVIENAGVNVLRNLYLRWVPPLNITVINGFATASLGKLAVNVSLANRISMVNSLSEVCNSWGVNFSDVSDIVRNHPQLRNDPFDPQPSVGFGGTGLVDDISHMAFIANSNQLTEIAAFYNNIVKVNEARKKSFVKAMHDKMNSLRGKKIAILGFTHKRDTENVKNSPAIQICEEILKEEGAANVCIFDPRAHPNDITLSISKAERIKVHVASSAFEACDRADAILILTDWPEFSNLNYTYICNHLMTTESSKDIFIGRNIPNFPDLEPLGFRVHYI